MDLSVVSDVATASICLIQLTIREFRRRSASSRTSRSTRSAREVSAIDYQRWYDYGIEPRTTKS